MHLKNTLLKMRRQTFKGGVTGNGFEFISNYKKALSPKFFRESCRGGNRDERAQNGTDFKVKRGEGILKGKTFRRTAIFPKSL